MDSIIGTNDFENILRDKINLEKDEELEVTFKKTKKGKAPPYIAVGNGKYGKEFSKDNIMDAFDVIGSLSPKQLEIFLYFKNHVVENHMSAHHRKTLNDQINHVHLPKSGVPKADVIRKLLGENKNAQAMVEKNIIKRISSYEYMVNPYLLIPTKNFKDVVAKWESLQ
jgi:hypothetical protein